MTAAAVILWRHGRTAYNAAHRLQGQIDIELDDVGRWQAAEAAAHIADRHRPDRIVSSDLLRAASTARTLGDLVGVPVETDPRLRERAFGEWEGLTGEEIAERWPEQHALWRSGHEPQRVGAETRGDAGRRVAGALAELSESVPDDGTLVVVSHGAAITLALAVLLGEDPTTWRGVGGLHNAHWTLLRSARHKGTTPWYVEAHNLGPSVAVTAWNAGLPPDAMPSSTADAMRE